MSLEAEPKKENLPDSPKEISLNLDPRTGQHWFLDEERRVIVLSEEEDAERDRQQLDPTSETAPGHRRYAAGITMKAMPVAPGEIAPEEVPEVNPSEAMTAASANRTPEESPFESDAQKEQTQKELRDKMKALEGKGINLNVIEKRIGDLNSPASATRIAADIEVLSTVDSPLRRAKKAPWER